MRGAPFPKNITAGNGITRDCFRAYQPVQSVLASGGRTRARTWDPMIKSHLLYQLSYAPGTGPESLRKRASFSKATLRCPASVRDIPWLFLLKIKEISLVWRPHPCPAFSPAPGRAKLREEAFVPRPD